MNINTVYVGCRNVGWIFLPRFLIEGSEKPSPYVVTLRNRCSLISIILFTASKQYYWYSWKWPTNYQPPCRTAVNIIIDIHENDPLITNHPVEMYIFSGKQYYWYSWKWPTNYQPPCGNVYIFFFLKPLFFYQST